MNVPLNIAGLGLNSGLAAARDLGVNGLGLGKTMVHAVTDAVTAYQNQIALVLAQQGGPLSGLAGAASASADGRRDKQPATSTDKSSTDKPSVTSTDDKPNKQPAPDKNPTATTTVAACGRRRRQ